MKNVFWSFLFLLVCSPSFGAPVRLAFVDEYELPDAQATVGGTRLGGLSALHFDAKENLLYALSDDPGDAKNPGRAHPRFYTLLVSFEGGALKLVPKDVVELKRSGVPLPVGVVDPEAWIPLPSGNFLVSSEGQPERVALHKDGKPSEPSVPTLFETTRKGEVLREANWRGKFSPTDWSESNGMSPAQGVESLLVRGKQKVAIAEGPLYQDKELLPPHLKVILFDFEAGFPKAGAEFTYLLDPFLTPLELGFEPTLRDNGVSEALAVDEGSFLTIERGFYTNKKDRSRNVIRLYQTTWEGGASGTLKKKLVLDFDTIVGRLKKPAHPVNHILDNVEGLTWGPRWNGKRTLLAVSDDNFNPKQRTVFYWFVVE